MRITRQTGVVIVTMGILLHLSAPAAHAQEAPSRIDALQQLNGAVASLVRDVSGSVVQVLVTSYGPVDEHNRTDTDLVIGRQRNMGSGVVIDAEGEVLAP